MSHSEEHKSHRAGWLHATVLSSIAAHTGGASVIKGAVRVTFRVALAMALTAEIGRMFGVI